MTVRLTDREAGICLLAVIKADIAARWGALPRPWIEASDDEIIALTAKLGLPADDELLLVCPVCGREQVVERADYCMNAAIGGHPYTCGELGCPSHTVMRVVPVEEIRREGSA